MDINAHNEQQLKRKILDGELTLRRGSREFKYG